MVERRRNTKATRKVNEAPCQPDCRGFVFLGRTTSNGNSLEGDSLQTARCPCRRLFDPAAQLWPYSTGPEAVRQAIAMPPARFGPLDPELAFYRVPGEFLLPQLLSLMLNDLSHVMRKRWQFSDREALELTKGQIKLIEEKEKWLLLNYARCSDAHLLLHWSEACWMLRAGYQSQTEGAQRQLHELFLSRDFPLIFLDISRADFCETARSQRRRDMLGELLHGLYEKDVGLVVCSEIDLLEPQLTTPKGAMWHSGEGGLRVKRAKGSLSFKSSLARKKATDPVSIEQFLDPESMAVFVCLMERGAQRMRRGESR